MLVGAGGADGAVGPDAAVAGAVGAGWLAGEPGAFEDGVEVAVPLSCGAGAAAVAAESEGDGAGAATVGAAAARA